MSRIQTPASIWFYFLIAFSIPWGTVLVLALQGAFASGEVAPQSLGIMFAAMIAGPVLGSVAVTLATRGTDGLRDLVARLGRWRLSGRYFAIALLLVPTVIVVCLAVPLVFSTEFVPAVIGGNGLLLLAMGLGAGLIAGYFEEIGWTGVATPALLETYGVLRAGMLLGAVHGIWHLPAGFASEGAAYGWLYLPHFVMFWMVGLIGLRMLIVWLYARTGSVLVAQLTHASYTASLFILWPQVRELVTGMWWAAGFALALLVVSLAIVLLRPAGDVSPAATVR